MQGYRLATDDEDYNDSVLDEWWEDDDEYEEDCELFDPTEDEQ